MRTKATIAILFLMILYTKTSAQDGLKSIGIELIPAFNLPVLSNQKSINSDSNSVTYHSRLALSGGINYTWETSRTLKFQIGLNYADNGHRYTIHDLNFLDTIHKGIGRRNDLTQSGNEENMYSNVRYQYLEIPITAHFRLNPRPRIPGLGIYASVGVAPAFLLKHNEVVRLRGFTAQAKDIFYVDDTYFEANNINFGLMTGMRIEYKVHPKVTISADPRIKAYLLAGNKDKEKHALISIQSGITLNYLF